MGPGQCPFCCLLLVPIPTHKGWLHFPVDSKFRSYAGPPEMQYISQDFGARKGRQTYQRTPLSARPGKISAAPTLEGPMLHLGPGKELSESCWKNEGRFKRPPRNCLVGPFGSTGRRAKIPICCETCHWTAEAAFECRLNVGEVRFVPLWAGIPAHHGNICRT